MNHVQHSQKLFASTNGSTAAVWCSITRERWQSRVSADPKTKAAELLEWLEGRVESPAEFFKTCFPHWAAKL